MLQISRRIEYKWCGYPSTTRFQSAKYLSSLKITLKLRTISQMIVICIKSRDNTWLTLFTLSFRNNSLLGFRKGSSKGIRKSLKRMTLHYTSMPRWHRPSCNRQISAVSTCEIKQFISIQLLISLNCLASNGSGVHLLKPTSKRKRTAREMQDSQTREELEKVMFEESSQKVVEQTNAIEQLQVQLQEA